MKNISEKELELLNKIGVNAQELRDVAYERGFKEGSTSDVAYKNYLIYQNFNDWAERCKALFGWNPNNIKQLFLEKGYLVKNKDSYTIEQDSTYFIKKEGKTYISTVLTGIYETSYFQQKITYLKMEGTVEDELEALKEDNITYKLSLVEKKERCKMFKEYRESLVDKRVK